MQTLHMPPAIDRFLREYVGQRNRMQFYREGLVMLILVLGWVTLWCLADRLLQLPATLRLLVLLLTVLFTGVWLILLVRTTLFARTDPTRAALELEHLRPDLDERLATVCTRMRDGDAMLSSPELLEAISHQVEQCIEREGVPRMVSLRSLGQHALSAAMMLVCLGILAIVPLIGFPKLLHRFAMPWLDTPPVSTTQLLPHFGAAMLDLKERESFVLNVTAFRPGEDGVTLHYSSDGTTWDRRPMASLGLNQHQAVVGPIQHDEQFYLSSGDARTPVYDLRALRRPAVSEFRVRYEYPAYLGREPFIARNIDGLIEAPVGTRATVQIVSTERLLSATLEARDFSLPFKSTIERSVMEGSFTIEKDQPYSMNLVSVKGMDGKGPEGSQIRAIPDRAPFVQLVTPADDMRLTPRDITSIRYQAMDDYGLSSVAIRVEVNGGGAVEMPTTPQADPRRRDGEQVIDLANLGLKIGDVVAVNVVATDGAGQQSVSITRHLFASPHSVNTADYTRLSELQRSHEIAKQLGEDVKAAMANLDLARKHRSNEAAYATADAKYQQHIADSGQAAEQLRHSLARAMARTQDAKLNDLLASFADRAEVRMIEAHDLIDELGKGDAREQNARQRLERSQEQTRQMQQQLKALAEGELAAAALADRRNLKAAEEAQQSGKMPAQATEMLTRMRQDVGDQMRQLGLNPDDPEVQKHLETKINSGRRTAEESKRLDLTEPAQSWADQLLDAKVHAPMFDRRLAAAADVESLRGEGNLQRASDLDLSSRAAQAIWLLAQDEEGRIAADAARQEFVKAFGEMERQHASRDSKAGPDHAAKMAEAREQMARWAGDSDRLTGPSPANPDDDYQRSVAFEANEQMANRRYDRASELQRRMAMEQQQAMDAGQSLRDAEAVDQLAESQESLRQQLLAARGEASALAQRQREVAQRIEGQMDRGRTPLPGTPRDTRKDALAAIQAVQERLARMPQQLQEAMQSADVQFHANDLAKRLIPVAQTAPPERKAAAARAAERAAVAVADARKQTEMSVALVDPDVAKVMSTNLQEYTPETGGATRVLEQQLAPALQAFKQSAADNQAPELVRSGRQAREAIAEAQKELRAAQQALLDQDPLFAARMYADAAAAALSRQPPDIEGALANQQAARDSLNQQVSSSVRDAAAAHLSGLARFRGVYDAEELTAERAFATRNLSSSRQWGVLRDRRQGEFTAASREEDPSGYQRMLQIYFRTLGQAGEAEKK